jgi:GTP-binding protein LepA
MPIDVLSEYVYREDAVHVAREKLKKLKETLPRLQVQQILQGCIGGIVVAREDISPYRKDVLAKMSGGDVTRKNKLLDKQKKGKSKLNQHAKITLPQEALMSLIERN